MPLGELEVLDLMFKMEVRAPTQSAESLPMTKTKNLERVVRYLQTKQSGKLIELRYDVAREYAVFAAPKTAAVLTVFGGIDAYEVLLNVVRTQHKLFPSTTCVVRLEGLEEEAMEGAVERELRDLC